MQILTESIVYFIIYAIVLVGVLWIFRKKDDSITNIANDESDEVLGDIDEMIEVEIGGDVMPIRKSELAFWNGLTRGQKRKMAKAWIKRRNVTETTIKGKRVYIRKIPLK